MSHLPLNGNLLIVGNMSPAGEEDHALNFILAIAQKLGYQFCPKVLQNFTPNLFRRIRNSDALIISEKGTDFLRNQNYIVKFNHSLKPPLIEINKCETLSEYKFSEIRRADIFEFACAIKSLYLEVEYQKIIDISVTRPTKLVYDDVLNNVCLFKKSNIEEIIHAINHGYHKNNKPPKHSKDKDVREIKDKLNAQLKNKVAGYAMGLDTANGKDSIGFSIWSQPTLQAHTHRAADVAHNHNQRQYDELRKHGFYPERMSLSDMGYALRRLNMPPIEINPIEWNDNHHKHPIDFGENFFDAMKIPAEMFGAAGIGKSNRPPKQKKNIATFKEPTSTVSTRNAKSKVCIFNKSSPTVTESLYKGKALNTF